MNKTILSIFLIFSVFASKASGDLVLSVSDSDPFAGSSIELLAGETAWISVWASTEPGQTYTGVSIDIQTDLLGSIQAIAHEIENPNDQRWAAVFSGAFGDPILIDDSNAFAVFEDGISTNDLSDFVLHSQFQILALSEGENSLTFAEGSQMFTDSATSGSIWNTFAKGSAMVTVTGIPEPSGTSTLVLAFGMIWMRRFKQVD